MVFLGDEGFEAGVADADRVEVDRLRPAVGQAHVQVALAGTGAGADGDAGGEVGPVEGGVGRKSFSAQRIAPTLGHGDVGVAVVRLSLQYYGSQCMKSGRTCYFQGQSIF